MSDDQAALRPNRKLDAALALARYGFSIFPLIPNDKRPLIDGWQAQATNDEARVKQWWTTQPDANIGISTERLLVIDVDPRNGGDKTFCSLHDTQHLIGEEFEPTLAAGTQGAGTHMFYWLPDSVTARGGANKLGPGVDVKSHGGYVVGAGSTIDGREYFWKKGYEPDKRNFARAPDWLIHRCNTAKPKSADAGKVVVLEDERAIRLCREYIETHAPRASVGERGFTAYKVACRFYDFGVSKETCQDLLIDWSESHCEAPMDREDIEHAAWSALKNRENAIGAKHPDAPGFEPVTIMPQREPVLSADTKRPRLYRLTYAEAAGQALDNAGEPLIDGLLDRTAMSVWYGESNSGKTFVMLDAAWHIAAGRPWAHMTTQKGAVVYVAAEGGRGILKRVRALKERRKDAGDVPLYLIPCPVDLLRPEADLRPLAGEIKAIEAQGGLKVELVVIDTLSRAIAGGNENDSQDMGVFVGHLDALRTGLNTHVAVVHHTGKDKAKGARGHSLLRAATDTEIEIDERTVTVTKQRDMDGSLSLGFTLKPLTLGMTKAGREVTSCTVEMGSVGEMPVEPIALQPRLAEFFDEIETRLEARDDPLDARPCAFGWELACDCLKAIRFRQTSDKPVRRTTVLTMLSELSEKGWIKKVDKNQWVITVVGNVGNVGSEQSSLSENVGTLRGRHSDKTT